MRIFAFSDTHRHTAHCIRFLENMRGNTDAVLFAGDVAEDVETLKKAFPELPIYGVRGNNDYFANTDLPADLVLDFDGVKLFLTHGHRYKVKETYEDIADAAKEHGATVAVFGHTHQSCDRTENGVHIINPGSGTGIWPTCAVLEIENGIIKTDILGLR